MKNWILISYGIVKFFFFLQNLSQLKDHIKRHYFNGILLWVLNSHVRNIDVYIVSWYKPAGDKVSIRIKSCIPPQTAIPDTNTTDVWERHEKAEIVETVFPLASVGLKNKG